MYFKRKYYQISNKLKAAYQYFGIHNTFFGIFVRKQYAKKACKQIQKLCAEPSKKKLIICYDLNSSPPTIGDFLYILMLARYLCLKGQAIKIFVVTSELRDDWKVLNAAEKEVFFKFMKEISQVFIPASEFNYEQISWQEFNHYLNKDKSSEASLNSHKNFVVLHDRIIKRRPIYNHLFNIFNYLLETEDKHFAESFVLSAKDFASYEIEIPVLNKKFVTWHIRYNLKWGTERNLTKAQFYQMLSRIRSENPDTNVVIVSDQIGTDHYRKMIPSDVRLLYFSKDYGTNFFQDSWLILKSSKYYQYRSGGIGMIAIYSGIDYEFIMGNRNEISWAYPNFTSWSHHSNQKKYDKLLDNNTVA